MVEFFIEFSVFHFGVPKIIITDNGTQFVREKFTNTLSKFKIKHVKASAAYPQANGQVEVSNRTILQGLKKRIDEIPRCWVEELPNVLWAYRITSRSATGASPFRMAYGVEAVSPVKISLTSPRVKYFNCEGSMEGLNFHSDLVEDVRDEAVAKTLLQQQKIAAYFNKKIKVRQFLVNDLVLRESATSQPMVTGKFKAHQEGPYKVAKVVSPGIYDLLFLDETPIKNTWNGIHLRKFYQ